MVNENEITEVEINLETLEMQLYFEYADPNESDDEITHYLFEFFRNEDEYTKNKLLSIVRRGEAYRNRIKSAMKLNFKLFQVFLLKIKPDINIVRSKSQLHT